MPDKLKFLPDDQQESEEDLSWSVSELLPAAVVTSSDWTTETIISQIEKGNIQLNPRYQRRDAWRNPRKSQFIESLILGLPIPQLVLAERKDKPKSFAVIDGKQRLLSICQFVGVRGYQEYKLSTLKMRTDLNNLTYTMLCELPKYELDLTAFQNQTIRTVVVKNWQKEDYLYEIFLRLNNGSLQLSPQELRQALHPGPFADYIDDFVIQSEILRSVLNLESPDFRMRDNELVLRYVAFQNFITEYDGNLKRFLDNATDKLNIAWETQFEVVKKQGKDLELALATCIDIFGADHALRKWNGVEYEPQLNRAVFDIMAFYFSSAKVRRLSNRHRAKIVRAFEKLCGGNQEFRSSLEVTTKSIKAVSARFQIWGRELRRLLNAEIEIPNIHN